MMVNLALWIHSPLLYHLSQKKQGCLGLGVNTGVSWIHSWGTVDADDGDAPSETFLKLQRELADRGRLAQEKVETAAAAAAAAAADAAAHTAAKALAGRGGDAAGQSASLADAAAGSAAPSPTVVEVQNVISRRRLHELKAHFQQFGHVAELALMGKEV
jgi:hypothetical protein